MIPFDDIVWCPQHICPMNTAHLCPQCEDDALCAEDTILEWHEEMLPDSLGG